MSDTAKWYQRGLETGNKGSRYYDGWTAPGDDAEREARDRGIHDGLRDHANRQAAEKERGAKK